MKRMLTLILPVAALLLSGCQEQAMLLNLNPDGSGTIVVRLFQNNAMPGGLNFGPPGEAPPAPDMSAQTEQTVKGMAKNLGGVTWKEGKAVANAKGWKGYQGTYAFTDINQVKFSADFKMGGEDGAVEVSGGGDNPAYSFKFTPGSPASLTIVPELGKAGGEDAPAPELGGQEAAQQAQMMQMMAPMLAGMRMSGMIQFNGKITESNADFIAGRKKNIVLLYDVQMDKVLKNPALMKMMQENPNSPPDKTIDEDGMKMQNPRKQLKVSFQ